MYILVVVDMQKCWPEANNPATIKAVKQQIKKAIRRNCPVISVTIPYFSTMDAKGYPPMLKCLSRLLKGYGKHRTVCKGLCDDGAGQVLYAAEELFPSKGTKKLRLCGVKTAACLWAMVQGLCKRAGVKVNVVRNACHSLVGLVADPSGMTPAVQSDIAWQPSMWGFFEQLPNVRLISGR